MPTLHEPRPRSLTVGGLRTRYVPRSRIGQGLLFVSPWVDGILLIIFFLLIRGNFIIQPGVSIEIPEAPIRGGTRGGFTALVLSVETGQPGVRQEIVVFDDARFRLEEPGQVKRLRIALANAVSKDPGLPLILEADRRVQHGTLVMLYDIAREVGLQEVNVAAREPAVRNDT